MNNQCTYAFLAILVVSLVTTNALDIDSHSYLCKTV